MGNLLLVRGPSPRGFGLFGSRIVPRHSLGRVTMASIGIAAAPCRGQSISPGETVEPPNRKENRPFVVQVRFEPSRLARDYLAAAYEHVVPMRRRSVSPPPSDELDQTAPAQPWERENRAC